jgi:hypothetical protein
MRGWVLYLDADAFIRHLDFDLRGYFQHRSAAAAIFSGYCDGKTPYDVNSGGFAINLSDPVGQSLVLDWYRTVDRVPDDIFDRAIDWTNDLANDQHLLWTVLRRYVEDRKIQKRIIFETANQSYVNNGPFISQLLRSMYDGFAVRLKAVRDQVREIMDEVPETFGDDGPGIYMPTHHPAFLTSCGRRTDFGIETTGVAGGLLFGPYARLDAGRYVARIFGSAPANTSFLCDIAVRHGHAILVDRVVDCVRPVQGLLAELSFDLVEDVADVEIRVNVAAETKLCLHAIQFADDTRSFPPAAPCQDADGTVGIE